MFTGIAQNFIICSFQIANRDISKSVDGEFSGDIESGLKAVIETARYAPAYFATRLHKAMAGGGTDDQALIRNVVTRSEVLNMM